MRLLLLALLAPALAAQPAVAPAGGGPAPGLDGPLDEVTTAEREAISARLGAARADLQSRGLLADAAAMRVAPTLTWPLQYAEGADEQHVVANFVDVDARNPGFVRDYECNARSYDLAGYDHGGIDYSLWPFAWDLMDRDAVEVVAAAPGVLLGVDEGQPDRTCSWQGAGNWNAVYVQHDDGSVAWYGHLQTGSATTKAPGSAIARGERLGLVGSSGRSSGPHLHFEVHGANGAVVETNTGACNTSASWWQAQRPYYDSKLTRLATHAGDPGFAGCPSTADAPRFSDQFAPGARLYVAGYFRDQRAGQPTTYAVRTPSGAVWRTWTHAMTQPHYVASYWYWWFTLPPDAEDGEWTATATFEGEATTHAFRVGTGTGNPTAADAGPAAGLAVAAPAPNPAASGARLAVSVDRVREVRVSVFDVLGREVARVHDGPLAPGAGPLALDVAALPPGTFVVRVESEGAVVSRPLVVAR